MFKSAIIFCLLLTTSLLTACGGGDPEDEKLSGASSSTVTISSVSSSKSNQSINSISSKNSSSQRSSSRSSSSSTQAKPVTIQWSHPAERENGNYLELNEIGGYEIRIFDPRISNYTSIQIPGNSTTSYTLANYLSTMTIEIAVYDTQGLYSEFVSVTN